MSQRAVTDSVPGSGFVRLVWQAAVAAAAVFLPVAIAEPFGEKSVAAQPEFTPGGWDRLDDLPQGRLRTRLERLSPAARENAKRWLQSFHFTAHDVASLAADSEGGIYFTCRFNSEELLELSSTNADAISAAGTSLPVAPFPSSLVLHSRPGAQNVLYLNFEGEIVVNTLWNTELDRSSIPALPFSVDSDYDTYNETEQTIIRHVWMRVAEDFAPFKIDVTTERPATLTTRTAVALITSHVDRDGQPNPENDAGGVAYVSVFGTFNYARYRPAWVYHDNLGNSESIIAEVVSHEIGHNIGLSHDGRTDGIEYYNGHGTGDISWGPIMGTGYSRNVTQWSKGEYYNANNTQDDLAVIASKTAYKTDDHGNSAATATPIKLTDKTNVVSTTPLVDPANANPANKGVIEQNKDVDWFSFLTGSGPVKLAVSPLVMLSGTRGGNLDLSIELYDSSGRQLLTNNPPSTTSACIETNLPAGLYYIAIRNSGAGDPFSATPTGYTAYGSLGQYFLTGWVTDPTGVTTPPLAELETAELSRTGQTNHVFTVVYSDNVAVDVSTLDSSDIRVTGPNGYDRFASFIGVDVQGDGTPRRATYSVVPPNGDVWTAADNGVYAVWLEPQQVADTEGTWAPASRLGDFRVSIPIVFYSANMDTNPGWTMDALWQYGEPSYGVGGPRAGATGTRIVGYNLKGNYENSLAPRYATTPPINAAGSTTLSLRFQRWLRLRAGDTAFIEASTNGVTWVNVWTTSSRVQDSGWREVQYALPTSVVGSSTLQLRWGLTSNQSQTDLGWNIDDVEVLGEGTFDTAPPIATLAVANLTTPGTPNHLCTVRYTDETSVSLASLDSEDLWVTGPNGYARHAEFVGADVPSDAAEIVAIYSIPAPNGVWQAQHNGTYTIALLGGAVEDVLGHEIQGGVLGSFEVAIPTVEPGLLEVSPSTGWSIAGRIGGPFYPATATYLITNSGGASLQWAVTATAEWFTITPESGTLEPASSQKVELRLAEDVVPALPEGEYREVVTFVNSTTGRGNTTRDAVLLVAPTNTFALRVSVNEPLWGRVNPTGGQFEPGSVVELLAEPENWFEFRHWTGDVSSTENPLRLHMTNDIAVVAVFGEQLTSNYPTPLWWLLAHGYTNDFETAVTVIGANGLPVWQSYVAGLDPNDPQSTPRLEAVHEPGHDEVVLRWTTVPGRLYTLWRAPGLDMPFEVVSDAVDLPSTVTAYTNRLSTMPGSSLFRLGIRKR